MRYPEPGLTCSVAQRPAWEGVATGDVAATGGCGCGTPCMKRPAPPFTPLLTLQALSPPFTPR